MKLTKRGRTWAAVAVFGATFVVGAVAFPMPAIAPVELDAWTLMAPCANEDGPGPCVWDAGVEGNGVGASFYIGVDDCTYSVPSGARDFSFPCVDAYARDALVRGR